MTIHYPERMPATAARVEPARTSSCLLDVVWTVTKIVIASLLMWALIVGIFVL